MRPISRARCAEPPSGGRSGFVLLDTVLALAITGLLAAIVFASFPRGTSAARHAAYAQEVAALLKADRTLAARSGREVATLIDVDARRFAAASGRIVALPRDIVVDVLASGLCSTGEGTFAIVFSPDGRSCGAVVRLVRGARDWRVRINWLTAHVDVVAAAP